MEINKSYYELYKAYHSGENTREYIVLHHTAVVGDGNLRVLSGATNKVSCHYLVRQDGEVFKFFDEKRICWHAGESERDGMQDMNRYSIGIEVESDGVTFTDAQILSTNQLVREIIAKNEISVANVLRHKDIAPGRKIDISDTFRNGTYGSFEEYKSFTFGNTTMYDYTEEDKRNDLHAEMLDNSAKHKRLSRLRNVIGSEYLKLCIDDLLKNLENMNKILKESIGSPS